LAEYITQGSTEKTRDGYKKGPLSDTTTILNVTVERI